MDIPVLAMIERSGWVGRLILFALGFLSVFAWAIVFNRFAILSGVKKMHRAFKNLNGGAARLLDFESADPKLVSSPAGQLGTIAVAEYKRILSDSHSHSSVRDWSFFLQNQFSMASERMESEISARMRILDSGLSMLAIISSVAPFLGLLGTVWGIMDSFFEIGNQGNASLPVVAPGIAEALITTIVGLVVAIPAVFFYNHFVHSVERIEDELYEAKDMLLLRLRRDIFKLLYGGNSQTSSARQPSDNQSV